MSNSVIPNQKRYRDWKAPVTSKESMEPFALINGVGPIGGFNNVLSVNDSAETGYVTLSHNMSATSPQYKYLVDRLQQEVYVGGMVITPDGILTIVSDSIALGFTSDGLTEFTDAIKKTKYKELLIVASHAYIEDDSESSHSTYFRAIPNTTEFSMKEAIGWEDRSTTGGNKHYISKGKGMANWLAHPVVMNNLDLTTDIIIGLCTYNSATQGNDIINPYMYRWPTTLNMTDALWEEMVVNLPRVHKTKLHSISAPGNSSRWLLRNMVPGDTLEVYCSNLSGNGFNTNIDVMSIWPTEAAFLANNKPLAQVIFNNIHFPLVLKLSKVSTYIWACELFKQSIEGQQPLFKYVVNEYDAHDLEQADNNVVKINVINSTIVCDPTVQGILPPVNTLTLHTLYTFNDQGSNVQMRDTLDMWLTSEKPVTSTLSIPVDGTYSTDHDDNLAFHRIFQIPSGSKISDSVKIDEMRADEGVPRPYPMVVGTIVPSSDGSFVYQVGPPDNVVIQPSDQRIANTITVYAAAPPTSADANGNLDLHIWMQASAPVETKVTGTVRVNYRDNTGGGQSSMVSMDVVMEILPGTVTAVTQNWQNFGSDFSFTLLSLTPDYDDQYDYNWNQVVDF